MARPSKLTEKQWDVVGKRFLSGESASALGREYGVSEAAIRKRFSAKHAQIKTVANQLATAEKALESLPISARLEARTLADRLKGISEHLAGAAELGAMTAHRLSVIANTEAQKVDETNPMDSISQLKSVAALTDMANKASTIGLNLLAASKGQVQPDPAAGTAKQLTDDQLASIIAGGSA